MKASLKLLLSLGLVGGVLISCQHDGTVAPLKEANGTNVATAKYIVVFKKDLSFYEGVQTPTSGNVEAIALQNGISPNAVDDVYKSVISGFSATLTSDQLKKLKSDPRVDFIEEDKIITVDEPVEISPKGDGILAQTLPWGITAVGGSVNATTSTGVAWIVDTGVDLTHLDLNVNATKARTFITTGQDALSANDLNGHGSHVAGIVAAKNNSYGSIGVCAGAQVIPVKVLNYSGSGYISQIVAGLDYVRSNLIPGKVNVVNLSLGGGVSTSLDNAVTNLANAGAYVVIAAGNSSANSALSSPARVNGTRIFTISAFGSTGAFASFSNYGNPPIDYSAPGVNVYSCYKTGGYATMSGTSMAAPHVTGIILVRNGSVNYSGNVTGDKDGIPDKKARR